MKKGLSFILALILCLSICACSPAGSNKEESSNTVGEISSEIGSETSSETSSEIGSEISSETNSTVRDEDSSKENIISEDASTPKDTDNSEDTEKPETESKPESSSKPNAASKPETSSKSEGSDEDDMVKLSFDIKGYNQKTASSGIFVYPNNTTAEKSIKANTYGFDSSLLFVFDADGKLIEAGSSIRANVDNKLGSAQEYVKIPAGGFLVATGPSAPSSIRNFYNVVLEGAMLYNATMSVVFPAQGSYDKTSNKLQIQYNKPTEPSKSAIKFLFVGNSATYFNGSPIKLKGLAAAAGIEIDVTYCTAGSAYLSWFANAAHDCGKKYRSFLSKEKYDYIVFQDASIATYEESKAALDILIPLATANGATPVLYMRPPTSLPEATRMEGTKKLHDAYTKLAADFKLTCAPVADAFLKALEMDATIDLYADDNAHCSREGSYLIAATWLYTCLGVSPVGNNYTANISSSVVKTLQKAADDICKNGYPYPSGNDSITVDGVRYNNLALEKKYTSDGAIYSTAKWTDHDADGKLLYKLTDGNETTDGGSTDCACHKGKTVNITIDLEKISKIRGVKTDLFGNTSWGISDPENATVKVFISKNGTDFTEVGTLNKGKQAAADSFVRNIFSLDFDDELSARYVRFQFSISGNYVWASELHVYGLSE